MVNFSAIASDIKLCFQYPVGSIIKQDEDKSNGSVRRDNRTIEERHKDFKDTVNSNEIKESISNLASEYGIPMADFLGSCTQFLFKRTPAELLGGLVGLGGIGAFIAGTSPGAWIYEKATGVMDWIYEKARPLLQWGGTIVGGAGIIAGLSSLALFKKSLAPEVTSTGK